MQRKFLANLILMVILNLLVKPLAIFGIDAVVQNRVGTEAYGIYFSLLNFSVLFNILLDFGINNFTTKQVAQSPALAAKYFGKIIGFRLVLFVFYAVVSYTIALVLNWNSYELYLLSFLVFNQFIITLIAFVRSYFGGFLMFKTDAFISILDRLLLIILCGLVLYFPISDHPFQIEWFIWIQTICYVLALIISLVLLFVKIGIPKWHFKPVISYAIMRKSLPYALLILLMMIYSRVDSVMIERIHEHGKLEAGFYAQGFRLLSAFFMFAMLFSNLLYPMFSKMLSNKENVEALLRTSSKLLLGGAIIIAAVCYFNSEYILSSIYTNDVQQSIASFQWLMLSFIGMCIIVIYGTILTANGNLLYLNIISTIGIVLNLIVNWFLIPKYGSFGAALATFVTQSMVAIAEIIYTYRKFKLSFFHFETAQYLLFTLLVVGTTYYWKVNSLLELLGVCLTTIVLLLITGMINIRQLVRIIKR